MSLEFWLGILIAFPIGILTNLATPWIKSSFGKSMFSYQ